MTTREELKVDKARDEWRKLIAQGGGEQTSLGRLLVSNIV